MTATVRSTGVGNSGTGTSTTFTPVMPAGFVAGDLLIGVGCNGNGLVPTARPAGSASVTAIPDSTTFHMDIVRKVAVGGDVFTWTAASATRWAGCVIAITVGTWDTVTPLSGASGSAITTTATVHPTPSSTPTSPDSLILAVWGTQTTGTWTNSNTNPTMTEICDTAASGTGPANCAAYRSNAPPTVAAMSRSATTTVSTGNGCRWIAFVNPGTAVVTVARRPRGRGPNFRR